MSFKEKNLPLSGLKLITRSKIGDDRGYFSRLFCSRDLQGLGWRKPIAQLNHTYTASEGTVRGLHYQNSPDSEAKLVMCLSGAVWDVAVDLRSKSPTFLKWHAELISAENNHAMLIPEGFAHGFQTMSDDVELLYCHSNFYNPLSEAGLNVNDPKLAITWPLAIVNLSARDTTHPSLTQQYKGFDFDL
jgi:dTDP-4-dehydrorhamnose 3,5-epimerase